MTTRITVFRKNAKTTLLHAAAGNNKNLFALRYLIEKHNIVLDDRTDDNNLTVWEYAATVDNQKAVHYLLDRLGNDPKYVNKTLIAACKKDWQDEVTSFHVSCTLASFTFLAII